MPGFTRAFTTIFDSNLTTLLVAGVLFFLGSGTIKGFAVTLSIGILCSMFTAITFTRYFLKTLIDSGLVKNTKLYGGHKEGNKVNFIGKRKIWYAFSILLFFNCCSFPFYAGFKFWN